MDELSKDHIIDELESLRVRNLVLESKFIDTTDIFSQLRKQNYLRGAIEKFSSGNHEDQLVKGKEEIQLELENCKQKIKELENSVLNLTEENRDISSLLMVAMAEKETLEKSLIMNNEQKRSAILQFAERGLQKVGFGFIMGGGTSDISSESSGVNVDDKLYSDGCHEEVASLASSVERIMNNLRHEITHLKRSLEESRSENERRQRLIDKQAHEIAQIVSYNKDIKDREAMLSQNNEELEKNLKRHEEEVVRWREACELEAEAGKNILHEREEMVKIMQEELEKTRGSLNQSIEKLKVKDELVKAAIGAQKAAQKSVQIADRRATGLVAEIKELTRHVDELEKKDHLTNQRHIVRHVCWPWRTLKFNLANNNGRTRGLRVPEMQTLLP